jgi:glycine/D-amino acid oxidase-like deaminating enzyme
MLAQCDPHLPAVLRLLALAGAKLYPEFIRKIEDESGLHIDYWSDGTILLLSEPGIGAEIPGAEAAYPEARMLSADELAALEAGLNCGSRGAIWLPEAAIDPRQLITAALAAAQHLGVNLASGSRVTELLVAGGRISGVRTERTQFLAPVVVNCAGAWAGLVSPYPLPTRPVKGQMLSVALPTSYAAHGSPATPHLLRHVVRAPEVYLVPRSDGRVVIGSTLEEAGFDKHVETTTIQRLHAAAVSLLPKIAEGQILQSWAGLRPATPDLLPIMGRTAIKGYFVATGHYRDGILLAPITAEVMRQVVCGLRPELDLSAFTPNRFV